MKRLALAFVALTFIASAAAAQSLGELAKQEEARRKAIKAPSKVYSDADLKKVVPPTPAPSTPPAAAGQPQPAAPDAEKPKDAADEQKAKPEGEQAKEDEKDEAWWRNRITEARSTLERSKLLYDALQSRVNGLTADFAARDSPAERTTLANDRARTMAELQKMQKDIEAQTKAISDIEEEARKAGVPPGWLR